MLLLNGLVPTDANNLIFRGGFIGTLTILYLISPFLHKGERKYGIPFLYGCIIYSMLISAICFVITNNISSPSGGFLYFSFINQLSPFVLGILLYRNIEIGKYDKLKSVLFFILSILFFFYPIPFRAVIVPCSFSLSVFYLLKTLWGRKLLFDKILCSFGVLSYPIFLLHIFFVWDVPNLILQHFIPLNWVTCIIWNTVSLICIYGVSKLYNNLINLFANKINKVISRKGSFI